MKLLRSITRRGFNVGTAGWFTVLKPNTWFPASRLPGRFRYRSSQSAETTAVDHDTDHKRWPLDAPSIDRSDCDDGHIRSAVVDNAPVEWRSRAAHLSNRQ